MFQLKGGMNAEQLLATGLTNVRFEATHGQNITLDAFAQEMPIFTDVFRTGCGKGVSNCK